MRSVGFVALTFLALGISHAQEESAVEDSAHMAMERDHMPSPAISSNRNEEPKTVEAGSGNKKVSVVGFLDIGQVVDGRFDNGAGKASTPLDNAFLNRSGIALTYSGILNDKLHVDIGVGGLFWKVIPEQTSASSKLMKFGPGISQASAQYDFTENMNLKWGFFGYKYNADAVNLGEYLLRSEAYPSIIHTGGPGGWVWMNANEYKSMGLKYTWDLLDGAIRQDFLLFSEFNDTPIFDFSPAYVASVKFGKAFEIGGGFSLHRWIPIKGSVTTPIGEDNTYVKYNNFPEVQSHAKVIFFDSTTSALDSAGFAWKGGQDIKDTFQLAHPKSQIMQVQTSQLGSVAGVREGIKSQMQNLLSQCAGSDTSDCAYIMTENGDLPVTDPITGEKIQKQDGSGDSIYNPAESKRLTFKAIKVMGRASLDIGELLSMDSRSTGSFKLFGEMAVLGIQDQPYFYEKLSNRIPIMLGANIPTFGLLNALCVQMEYFKNPLPDDNFQQFQNALPQPNFPHDNPAEYEFRKSQGEYKRDDTKWSISLEKSIIPGLGVYAQVASDHFRVQDEFAQPSYVPILPTKSDWYYMVRLLWAM